MSIEASQTTKRLSVHGVCNIAVSDIVRLVDQGVFCRQLYITTAVDDFETVSELNLFSEGDNKSQLALFAGE